MLNVIAQAYPENAGTQKHGGHGSTEVPRLRTFRDSVFQTLIEGLVRPYVIHQGLEAAYKQMAQDEEREAEALEWAEATIGDVSDETR